MQGDTMSWRAALSTMENITGQTFHWTDMTGEEALRKEQELLQEGNMFGAFKMHILGEPARGSLGGDTSAEAKRYNIQLKSLEQTLQAVLL